jgi:hypothetical protein
MNLSQTVGNSKLKLGKNSNFELGQIRNSKITFDFPKQLEKLPT